jgi:hypothetical protein
LSDPITKDEKKIKIWERLAVISLPLGVQRINNPLIKNIFAIEIRYEKKCQKTLKCERI